MPRSRPHGGGSEDGSPAGRPARPRAGDAGSVDQGHQQVAAAFEGGRVRGDRGPAAPEGESTAPSLTSASPEAFVDGVVGDPRSVAGRSAQDIADQFNAAGYTATVEPSRRRGTSGNAVQVRIQGHPEITNIQVHPGGGRHTPEGSPYWKISTSTAGKTWVIPGDFRGADELGGNVVRYDG